jgi:hypothetical protein
MPISTPNDATETMNEETMAANTLLFKWHKANGLNCRMNGRWDVNYSSR